ncbi:hypothetical protein V12B01_13675 [Vibrio splendidus 12B01]|nr:hypothetical protein V12B01_13675 [Vibrio splendidus 12B01]
MTCDIPIINVLDIRSVFDIHTMKTKEIF